MPENWILAKSDSGWMRSDIFYEFVCNEFNKWLDTNNIKKPIILFIDGHKSHMTLPLSQFCQDHGIILYARPPSSTHIIQPADVSVFKPLKHEWKKTVRKWQSKPENTNAVVIKINFCSIFEEALEAINMVGCIKNGFRSCGLFPFEPNNIDYTKCVKNTLEKQTLHHKDHSNSVHLSSQDFISAKKVAKAIKPQLYDYGINVEQGISNLPIKSSLELSTDKERNEPAAEDVHLEHHTDLLSKASASRNESEEKSTTHKHPEQASALLSSQNTLQSIKEGQKPVTEDILQEHHSDSPLEESSLCEVEVNRTNKDDMSTLPNMHQIAQVTADKLSSQGSSNEVKETSETSPTTPFSRHLSFPTPVDQVERSRMKEKLPSAISCKEWRKYYEKKEEEKQKKLENKPGLVTI
nr:unnamed protein product [Callosobruchus analis]